MGGLLALSRMIDAVTAFIGRHVIWLILAAILVSARTGEGLDDLKARIAEFFADRYEDVRLLVPHDRGAALSALYESGAPITAREDAPDGVLVTARLPQRLVNRFAAYRADGR